MTTERATIESIRRKLREFSIAEHRLISEKAGIPLDTLRKVAYGITANPRYDTYIKLDKWYRRATR